jgi:DNA invertase Pin-like site-specific DNA recombinase
MLCYAKNALDKYAKDTGFENLKFLYDDGFSGTNFQRPAWTELMALMENGEVAALIVKDYCAIIGLNQKDLENQGILA